MSRRFQHARQPPEFTSKTKGRRKKYHIVRPGDAIQVLVSLPPEELSSLLPVGGVHMLPTSAANGIPTFWFVLGLYKVRHCPFVYAHVRAIQPSPESAYAPMGEESGHPMLEPTHRINFGQSHVLVRLNEVCCRALLLHCCHPLDGACADEHHLPISAPSSARFNRDTITTARWTVYGSRQGFPPRSS